jgi:hypothetical protein
LADDKTVETHSSCRAFYDHGSKAFEYVQLKENIWHVVAVTGGREGE